MRAEKRLSARAAATAGPGLHADGGGLYLTVDLDADDNPRRRWFWRYSRAGKRRDMGLGPLAEVSLAQARAERDRWRDALRAGKDPIEERARERSAAARQALTFGEAADAYIASLTHYRDPRRREQWTQIIRDHADALRKRPLAEVSTADVLGALKPLWTAHPATAGRLRSMVEAIIDAHTALGHIDEARANPARWRGHLDKLLPRQKQAAEHHPAMPYPEVPAFVKRLRAGDFVGARAIEFLILTAARTGEVLGATMAEMDLDKAVWTVPKDRMKAGRDHRVPLSPRAVEIVREVAPLGGAYVFPGLRRGSRLSDRALARTMESWEVGYTIHGFRSSFRDWAGDCTSHPREIAEAALAHSVGSATEAAYRRGDALARRRALMDAWAIFIDGARGAEVIQIGRLRPKRQG